MINSPIKWSGGKSKLRKKIISLLPPHNCYVEVFGGAGWVLFGKPPSQVEILNDIDGDLINFFRVVKDKPEEFIESFKWDLVSFAEFKRLCAIPSEQMSDIQRARKFYYVIMASWGGEYGNPRFQTSITDRGGHGNRLVGALENLESRIKPAHQRLKTVIVDHRDWRECISRYDQGYVEGSEGAKVVFYLDPPYPNNPINYRHNMIGWDQHEELVSVLRNMRSRFLLTIYDIPQARELFNYEGFHLTEVEFAAGMPNGDKHTRTSNKELIVSNYIVEPTPQQLINLNADELPHNQIVV